MLENLKGEKEVYILTSPKQTRTFLKTLQETKSFS